MSHFQIILPLLLFCILPSAFSIKLTPDKVDDLLQLFDRLPQDGGISPSEVDHLLSGGDNKEAIDKIFTESDKNGDGRVDRDEMLKEVNGKFGMVNNLVQVAKNIADKFIASSTNSIMALLDENKDGSITKAEMEEVVAPGSCQMFKDFVQKADVNGDGKADRQELLGAMAKEGEGGGK